LLALGAALWPGSARAQLRYLLHGDVRESYNSNVYAGAAAAEWDMVTELEPGFRLYYNMPTSYLWLRYFLLFQIYARTEDPSAGRMLFGYANNLDLEFTHLFTQRTGILLLNRFNQGTENTSVFGQVSEAGSYQGGFLTTSSKYISERPRLELQHLFSQRWSMRPRLDATFYYGYDRSTDPNILTPPDVWEVTPSIRVELGFENDLLFFDLGFTALSEKRAAGNPFVYPGSLSTYVIEGGLGWRHYFNEFWDVHLTIGLDYRGREFYGGQDPNWTVDIQGAWGPLGSAGVRYRRARNLILALDYAHRYELTIELGNATTADTDEITFEAEYNLHDWRFELAAGFRYLRAASRELDAPVADTKLFRGSATVSYLIRSGISVEAAYALDLVRDRPILSQSGTPILGQPPPDWDRHLITIGFSFAWPAPPPQDVRLTRRTSEYEPIFSPGEGGSRFGAGARDDESMVGPRSTERRLREERRERERRERELQEHPERALQPEGDPNVFDTEPQPEQEQEQQQQQQEQPRGNEGGH